MAGSTWRQVALLAAGGMAVVLVVAALGAVADAPASPLPAMALATGPAATYPATSPAASPAVSITVDGVYVVGRDILAGTWRTAGVGALCYWERDKDLRGEFDSIAANGVVAKAPVSVALRPSDVAFTVTGGCAWVLVR